MSWRERPNPGDMKLCQACPHRREDARRDYRCAVTGHHPYLPPLVEYTSTGAERCGWWPPKVEVVDERQLDLLGGDAA